MHARRRRSPANPGHQACEQFYDAGTCREKDQQHMKSMGVAATTSLDGCGSHLPDVLLPRSLLVGAHAVWLMTISTLHRGLASA